MSKLDEKIDTYADAVRTKCGQGPDVDLPRKVTSGLDRRSTTQIPRPWRRATRRSSTRIKQNIKKLGLNESDDLDGAIDKPAETYGRSDRAKHRAVIYYLLMKHFGKAGVYT